MRNVFVLVTAFYVVLKQRTRKWQIYTVPRLNYERNYLIKIIKKALLWKRTTLEIDKLNTPWTMSAYNIGFYLNSLLLQSSFCHLAHTVQTECEIWSTYMKYFLRGLKHLRQAKQNTNEKREEREQGNHISSKKQRN